MILHLLDHGFQALLKVAAIAGASQKGAHIKAVDRGVGQNLGCFLVDDLLREAFRNRGLADARIAHQQRVVLATAAEHLNGAFHLGLAADQRINFALSRLHVQIDAIFGKRRFLCLPGFGFRGFVVVFFRAGDRARFAEGWVFRHAMRDEIHRIIAGHILFLQEIGGVGLAFGEDRHQHIRAGNFGAPRGLHMDRGALDHALESCGRHRFRAFHICHQRGKVVVDEFDQRLAQFGQID
ncbi:MAG: hypothetical protein ACD_54C00542G0001 [uncultured bacterium]|nr:MAG: hypothetical protein ACD_54C00542G0001 [uncultured bacterium]